MAGRCSLCKSENNICNVFQVLIYVRDFFLTLLLLILKINLFARSTAYNTLFKGTVKS